MLHQSGAPTQVNRAFRRYRHRRMRLLRTATGAHKMANIDNFHQGSLTLKVKDHSDMLSAQYILICLEEDHVSHCITTKEPRPIPMKETLHSRHHPTVLTRFCAIKKESLQNLYIDAVDSASPLLGNNRVLKDCPPPIADEG